MHSGQLRIDGQAFVPARDIVNMFPHVLYRAAELVAVRGWPILELKEVGEKAGATQADLAAVLPALYRFLQLATDPRVTSYEACFEAAGLKQTHPAARLAVFCQVGASVLNHYYHHARTANRAGHQPAGTDDVAEAADKATWAAKTDLPSKQAARVAEIDKTKDHDGNVVRGDGI